MACSASMNSSAGTNPSDLRPKSTTTPALVTAMTLPSTISPSVGTSCGEAYCSINSLSSSVEGLPASAAGASVSVAASSGAAAAAFVEASELAGGGSGLGLAAGGSTLS